MPVAARPSQASVPISQIIAYDYLDVDAWCSIESLRSFEAFDVLSIDEISVSVAPIIPISIASDVTVDDILFQFNIISMEAFDEIDIDSFQNYTEQYIEEVTVPTVDPGDSTGRIDNLEMELALVSTNPTFYKEFEYSSGALTGYTVYADQSKTSPIFVIAFGFVNDKLNTKTINRVSDNKLLTIQFNYSGDILISQTRSVL